MKFRFKRMIKLIMAVGLVLLSALSAGCSRRILLVESESLLLDLQSEQLSGTVQKTFTVSSGEEGTVEIRFAREIGEAGIRLRRMDEEITVIELSGEAGIY